ncbi:MAG: peptidylprolyl isomerase [Gemmatimonadetes bacterium]|nr:peptidylprolyl isomerase [Gemmatimonadota bacterium]
MRNALGTKDRIARVPNARLLPLLVAALVTGCGGGDASSGNDAAPAQAADPLLDPRRLTETAPDRFRVRFETSAGPFVIEAHREWAPLGADRFYNLVRAGYYDDTRVYRVVDGFVAEFGVHGNGTVTRIWHRFPILDDPVVESNTRGRMSFAASGPNSRTVQVFVNLRDNASLDARGFAPFAEVVEGLDVVSRFHAGYGDGPPRGSGPYQAQAVIQGNAYLDAEFPDLTRIESARLVDG